MAPHSSVGLSAFARELPAPVGGLPAPAGELSIPYSLLETALSAEGITLVAALEVEHVLPRLKTGAAALSAWQDAGYAGEMAYMRRNAGMYASLEAVLPDARTIVSMLVPYAAPGAVPLRRPEGAYGRVARYAWGRDYHRVLRGALRRVVTTVQRDSGHGVRLAARAFADAVPILERSAALGVERTFLGRNSMLIRPGIGSYTFLAEIVWNATVTGGPGPVAVSEPEPPGAACGRCRRCIDSCPTGAIVADGVVDARRCISYLTIEKRGPFSPEERKAVGEWVFGCDLCQDVCPFNHAGVKPSVLPALEGPRGAGPFLALSELLAIRDQRTFATRFAGTPLMRPGRVHLLRNAAAVSANLGARQCLPMLAAAAAHDPSALVRAEAGAALERMG